jgi:sulfatase-like protein
MAEPFRGVVNVDIRDSEPDWSPFEPPTAPEGAPNVVYIVLDDVGFSAVGCYGGPIETPNIDRIAAAGVRFTQWHTTALARSPKARSRSSRAPSRWPVRGCASGATAARPSPTTTRVIPLPFTGGTIKRVAVDVSGEPYVDLEREAAALILRE